MLEQENMELRGMVSDLMKHIEVQSAVSNAEKGIKEVGISVFIGSRGLLKLPWSVVDQKVLFFFKALC